MEPAYTSINTGGIQKIWFIYTTEFCATIKKDKIMTFAEKMDAVGTHMSSKINQIQKDKD